MASVTLAESAKLSQDMLVQGVIENVVTVNPFYDILPFQSIDGNALSYNRENALGAAQWTGVGTAIAAGKAAATFSTVTSTLTTLVGDAEVNGLIQATRSNITDQKAAQVASKAKSIGRAYQDKMVNGDGSSNTISGLLALATSAQTKTGATNGSVLSYDLLDETMDLVTSKDGDIDFMLMNARTIRSYLSLLRALGGAGIGETMELPSGATVPTYRGVPIFRNDYIPVNQTRGTSTASTSIMMGTLDDGSMTHGIAGLTAAGNAGISIEEIGSSETKDETITRVKFYNGLANFSEKGLAMLNGITN